MKNLILPLTVFLSIAQAAPVKAGKVQSPQFKITPGLLCSKADPDFSFLDYPEKIARCARNIGDAEKTKVAATYGNIPRASWVNYEFDHLLPVCAGGSNSADNLWPQPIIEAHKKDILEVDICLAMKAGTLKQVDAVKKIYNWFSVTQPQVAKNLLLQIKKSAGRAVTENTGR